jgi:phage repressor protein C with HTH and peptisase S24 domain
MSSRSASVVNIADYTQRTGEYCILTVHLPGQKPQAAGVLLLDPDSDRLLVKPRHDWTEWADEEDREVLAEIEADLLIKAEKRGGSQVMNQLEEEASWAFRLSDRQQVSTRDFERTLLRLYREHVSVPVQPFKTHLPVYSLEVAAGPFLSNAADVRAEEWVETPSDLRLTDQMFVATIRGRSMEPLIPDGSLCVFRRNVVGSRNGRLVLVRGAELADESRFTVKRYKSEKAAAADDSFTHTRVRLESLNPEFPWWDLDRDEDKYQIVAEFVRVLD